MFVFCVANQKGGVGKTATADALAAYITKHYKIRTLAIDLDPQCNLTAAYGVNPYEKGLNVRDVLLGTVNAKDAITEARGPIIRGSMLLNALEEVLKGPGRNLALKKALEPLASEYQAVVCDTAPGLSLATINALFAADCVLIPALADVFTMQGIRELLANVKFVQGQGEALQVGGIFFTRHNPRGNVTQYAADKITELADSEGVTVFNGYVRECIAIKEAQAMSSDIFSYAKKSNAAADYESVFNELFKNLNKEG